MNKRTYTIFIIVAVLTVACGSPNQNNKQQEVTSKEHRLELPTPPLMLTSDSARFDFMASHYWDNFDFSDTTWVTDTTVLRETFIQWASLLMQVSKERGVTSAAGLIGKSTICPPMLMQFIDLADDCFRHPNSPLRNEELHIAILNAVIEAPHLDSLYKVRPLYQLQQALKNRPGMTAADFTYTMATGAKNKLSSARGDYTLLLFYNPDCHDCARVENYIVESRTLAPLIESGRLAMVAIYPDADLTAWRNHLPKMPKKWTIGCDPEQEITEKLYNLPAIPCLYLLDKDKKVILKDVYIEQIEEWLQTK